MPYFIHLWPDFCVNLENQIGYGMKKIELRIYKHFTLCIALYLHPFCYGSSLSNSRQGEFVFTIIHIFFTPSQVYLSTVLFCQHPKNVILLSMNTLVAYHIIITLEYL